MDLTVRGDLESRLRGDEGAELVDGKEVVVAAAVEAETGRDRRSAGLLAVFGKAAGIIGGQDGVVGSEIDRVETVAAGDHLFMEFFPGSHSDHWFGAGRTDGLGQI
jgi:hypothetical protein